MNEESPEQRIAKLVWQGEKAIDSVEGLREIFGKKQAEKEEVIKVKDVMRQHPAILHTKCVSQWISRNRDMIGSMADNGEL